MIIDYTTKWHELDGPLVLSRASGSSTCALCARPMSEPAALSGCRWNDLPALCSEIDSSIAASAPAVNLMKKERKKHDCFLVVICPVLLFSGGVTPAEPQ